MKLVIGGTVLALVTGYVAYLGASSSWQYYLTVDECAAHTGQFIGRRVRVSGRVAAGSLHIREGRSQAAFVLQGQESNLPVECPGPLPDNLAEEMDVVVEGTLDRADFLQGRKILTRCASKYESGQSTPSSKPVSKTEGRS
ncbi:MAG: cytochrome c maturation protein CcmE [Pirellulaceae bacterium]|nr:cytochrome c maturation protein CcmE [Pirellulaceae bacterium]